MGTDPCLNLKVDIKPFSEASDWDSSSSTKEISSIQQSIGVGQKYVQNMQTRLPNLIMNQVMNIFTISCTCYSITFETILTDGENVFNGNASIKFC